MTTKIETGMVKEGFATVEALAALRSLFVGSYQDFAYEPGDAEPWWLPCYGQTVLIAAYPALFAKLGVTYGGNGTTTFGIPDRRGRVLAGKDNMGGTSANRLTNKPGGLNGDVLGAAGGAEEHTLTEAQMPQHGHTITINPAGGHDHDVPRGNTGGGAVPTAALGNGEAFTPGKTSAAPDHAHGASATMTGGGQAHNNTQPTIIGVVCILAF